MRRVGGVGAAGEHGSGGRARRRPPRLRVVRHRLLRLVALEKLVADLVVRRRQQVVVAAALLHELHHLRPLAEAHAELEREVAAVHLAVELLGVVEPAEVHRHLGRLLLRVEQLELLDELDPEVVLALHGEGKGGGEVVVVVVELVEVVVAVAARHLHERLLGDSELELLQCGLAHQPPQPRVRVRLGVGIRVAHAAGAAQRLAALAQRLRLEGEEALGRHRLLGVARERVERARLHLEIGVRADVGGGDDRLVGREVAVAGEGRDE